MGNPIEALLDINLPFRKAISRITSGVFYSFSFFSKKQTLMKLLTWKQTQYFQALLWCASDDFMKILFRISRILFRISEFQKFKDFLKKGCCKIFCEILKKLPVTTRDVIFLSQVATATFTKKGLCQKCFPKSLIKLSEETQANTSIVWNLAGQEAWTFLGFAREVLVATYAWKTKFLGWFETSYNQKT